MFKWIFGLLGFFLFGRSFLGAVVGFIIGSGIDNYQRIMSQAKASGQAYSPEDLFNFYQQRTSTNSVATMLMALSAAVMQADGKVVKSELEYVKAFFKQQFGPSFSPDQLQVLKRFLDSGNIPLEQICFDIRTRMQPEVRLQLLHYLFGIAKADGDVSPDELRVIDKLADLLQVPHAEYESIKNMFYRNVDSDYIVLGITPDATDDEVKKAYRSMAIKFHPDKVAAMGDEYQKGAKEKFQKIQESYEAIKKRRNMK